MSEKDHDYKADTKISMQLSIGLVGCSREADDTIEGLTGLTQSELDSMSREKIDEQIDEAVSEWSYGYIDRGWSAED